MTKPLFDVFREALLANPDGSRKEAQDAFVDAMRSNPIYLEKLAVDYFVRMSAVYAVKKVPHGNTFGRVGDKRTKRDEASQRTQAAFSDLKAKMRAVILLDLALPNGKLLRQSTGTECAKAGGFFAEVAKHIKPTQTVDRHLSEAELQNIRARFYQRNAA